MIDLTNESYSPIDAPDWTPVWVANQPEMSGYDCSRDYLAPADVSFVMIDGRPCVADYGIAQEAVAKISHGPDMEDWEEKVGPPKLEQVED